MLTILVVDYPCSERDAETSGGHSYQHDSRHNSRIKYKFRKFIKNHDGVEEDVTVSARALR